MRNGQSTDLVNIGHKTQSEDEHNKKTKQNNNKTTKQNKTTTKKKKNPRKTEKMRNMEATKKNTIVQPMCS